MTSPFLILSQFFTVIKKRHLSIPKRFSLLSLYLKILIERFIRGRVPGFFSESSTNFLFSRINFCRFDDFFWTFISVFIDEEYYFKTNKKSPQIIDCGGNIGLVVLYFKWIYPLSRVTVFEPIEENTKCLEKNTSSLSGVRLINAAVSGNDGYVDIYGVGRAATIDPNFIKLKGQIKQNDRTKRVSVVTEKLSKYIDSEVDYLKIDIEGAEGEVIEELAASDKLKMVDRVGMEYHHYSLSENRLSEIIKHLELADFNVSFSGNGSLPSWRYYNFMLYAKRN